MPRELTNLEIDSFLERHPDVEEMTGWGESQLTYPNDGEAILDPSGRYVLVWRDYSNVWHFIDLSDMSEMQELAGSVNAPTHVSDPDYLSLIHERLGDVLGAGLGIGAGLAVLGLAYVVGRKL